MRSIRQLFIVALVFLAVVAFVHYRNRRPEPPRGLAFKIGIKSADKESAFVQAHPLTHTITSVSDLLQTVQNDSALAAFYSQNGFNVNCASMTILAGDVWITNSWRRGAEFGFTTHVELLLAGERVLISCGKPNVWIKAACGNLVIVRDSNGLISDIPIDSQLFVYAAPLAIPTSVDLPDSVFNPGFNSDIPTYTGAPTPSESFVPPPPNYCCGGTIPNPSRPVPTPEPSSFSLVIEAFVVMLAANHFLRRDQ